jgi:hypothetical protein
MAPNNAVKGGLSHSAQKKVNADAKKVEEEEEALRCWLDQPPPTGRPG